MMASSLPTDQSFRAAASSFEDSIANICWFPSEPSPALAVSSWDSKINLYKVSGSPIIFNLQELNSFATEHPCLALCHHSSLDYLIVGSLDGTISAVQTSTGNVVNTVGKHDDAVQGIYRGSAESVFYSVSYDSTLRIWDVRASDPLVYRFDLGAKVVCSDMSWPNLIVGYNNQKFQVIDLQNLAVTQRIGPQLDTTLGVDSPLTDVSISKFGAIGLGSSSGRSAISWITPSAFDGSFGMNNTYCFKGHKLDAGQSGNTTNKTIMYPINAVGMHPKNKDTYFTAGRDGAIHFWNITKRSRMSGFVCKEAPITKARYSPDGKYLAYGAGYDWSSGIEGAKSCKTRLCVHAVQPNELPKP